ncbi:MAG: hypothetical protein IT306_25525 [Chloroflexi bacterium]|nr:hypothetical protein [Chloroflexota bacterium]
MPKEPRVQAQATMRRQHGGQGTPGPSVVTVFGILLVAVSLVAVGAAVTFGSLRGSGTGGDGRAPDPTPTPAAARATPILLTVGPRAQATDGGPTPAAGGTGAPSLIPPSTSGGPLFAPSVPSGASTQPPSSEQQAGSPSPASTAGSPAAGPAADPQTAPSPASSAASPAPGAPLPIPPPLGSPTAAMSPAERAAAEAFARLTTDEEKVGQLLLLAWIGGTAEEARPALRDLKAGGIVHVQNTTTRAGAATINRGLDAIAAEVGMVRPLIAIDHEGGNVQRITDVENLRSNWEFAASGAKDLQACQRGQSHAETLRSMGFSMNLAPVLDVNNNPANPVIGRRSYSDDPEVVARLGAAYVRGLQGGGVAAVGKHFPGHGNTSTDSHLGLPSLPMSVSDLDRIELVPFRRAIDADIAGIMSAHIVFPAVDQSGVPGTLSRPVMTGLLRERLGFKGLSVSDDMGAMKAITDNYTPGDAAVRAVQAGVDMIILSAEFPRQKQSRDALVAAVSDGRITQDRLNEAVQHVLLVKARFGLLGEPAVQPGGGCS